jgi:tRNA uridine 5-carboxymethylaminomethyl modification enzyme
MTLGLASRISGVTPAAISLLLVHLKKKRPASAEDGRRQAQTPAELPDAA